MTQTAKKPVLPAILGILFLIPPFMYMLSHLVSKRITLYSYDAFFYSNFRRIWNYIIVPNIWKDLLSCTWFGFVFLVLAVGFFIIKKTKIPACVGLGLLAVTMFVNACIQLVNAVKFLRCMNQYATAVKYFYLLNYLLLAGLYFVICLSMILFIVSMIKALKIKALGVIGCVIMPLASIAATLLNDGLIIYYIVHPIYHIKWTMFLPLLNSFFFDMFIWSIIIPCFIAFVFKAKSLKNLLQ